MILKFADGTTINTTGNITMFLWRNFPKRVDEWLNHKERFDYEMRRVDTFLRQAKEARQDG